ncbi:hypothetical protein [Mucilaginibacter segetis]|uniref:Uncharacterized protein n=1 Tax=Mucilaginibacter segetis TaxID=2793071 RepID=A0A934PRW2_9SPHI|nr:hypothetical protein [Mucilaginibacter segetis]MBK0379639.1 hypothetical protein [Mucilaginibacter segetis]
MNKQLIVVTLLLILVLNGCKKDKNDQTDKLTNLEGSYHSSTNMELTPPVMYTQSGITTDITVIKNYLTRKNIIADFKFDTNTESVQTELLTINIDENLNVNGRIFVEGFASTNYKNVNGIIITQSDTDMLIQGNKPDTTYLNNYIFLNVGKTEPINSALPNGKYVTLPQLRLAIKGRDIYLSELKYYYYSQNNNGYSTASSHTYDLVNPNLCKELFSRDTVIVQQGLIKLIK